MSIKELYEQAVIDGHPSLELLIEFLVFEKEVIDWNDDKLELDLYFKPNNRAKMNNLLREYKDKQGRRAG